MTRDKASLKILLATTNRGKAREIEKYLSDLDIRLLCLRDLKIRKAYPEKGMTFRENARGKSTFYSQQSGFLTLAEDSGLEIDRLNGAPGVHSARFSSPGATDEKNIRKVLRLMKGVPFGQRKARFVSCLVLSCGGDVEKEVVGEVRGYIALAKKGSHGFGYDPIFYYPPLAKMFAELEPEEKNKVSHRGRALRKMKAFLRDYLKIK
jgi:XTP/dITP diphosphohydrolase